MGYSEVRGRIPAITVAVVLDRYQLHDAMVTYALDLLGVEDSGDLSCKMAWAKDDNTSVTISGKEKKDVVITEHRYLEKAARLINAANFLVEL